ncbi:hypothetical protein [Pseudomonas siliginis]|jgi:hypothetical protein|uniref:hypothetical protein n=1 Tax=Pseudomonas siliginis TaxID=2842346 RepID=UPI002092F026|nr:hypothetical protein [Pseudomonas siliginis]UST78088.1 hypothetical protein NF676_18185 [Pseudomonas siliginis]
MPTNITFRTQLLGGVSEFCHGSQLPLLNNALILVELVVLLARYQEEGVALAPNIYITDNIDAIGSMLPDGERLKIGVAEANEKGLKQALKKCAPLAAGGWLIYIQDRRDNIEYGLFKGASNPISVPVDDILMDPELDFSVVKAYQIANDCVEIRCNNESHHYIFLNHRKEDSPPPLRYLDELITAITDNSHADEKEPTAGFLKRLLFEALRKSHGCIIAVTNLVEAPRFLSEDGVMLDEPINFPELVRSFRNNEESSSRIDSKETLLNGMLNSDGIIVFNNSGQLLGYNCFVKTKQEDGVVGGARKRAFATIEKELGRGLSAVFMQSQDGWSDFKGVSQ